MDTCKSCATKPNKFSMFEDAIRSEMKERMVGDMSVGVHGLHINEIEYDMLQSAKNNEFEDVTPAQAATVIENVANSIRRDQEAEREFYEEELFEQQIEAEKIKLEEDREKIADAANLRPLKSIFEKVGGGQ